MRVIDRHSLTTCFLLYVACTAFVFSVYCYGRDAGFDLFVTDNVLGESPGRVVRAAGLWCAENRRKAVSSRMGFAKRRMEHSPCQPSSEWVSFSKQGRLRQRKGSDFHQLCPRYSGTPTPTAPTAFRLWEIFTFTNERRPNRVVRETRLWCRETPEGRQIEPGLRHSSTGKVFLSTQQFFSQGRIREKQKGEGFSLSSPVLKPPLPLRLLCNRKPLPFLNKAGNGRIRCVS